MLSKWLIRSILAVLVLALFLGGSSFLRLKSWLYTSGSANEEVEELKSEVAVLKAKIAELSGSEKKPASSGADYQPAKVYATYPFNMKQTITINAGARNGVAENMTVVSGEKIFVGKVISVSEDAAEVQTIFDPNFEMPVRLGEKGVDAIVRGGAIPFLDLIPKDAKLVEGESVVTSGTVAPYGTPVGTLSGIQRIDYESFQKAGIELPYTINDLREVFVITNYVARR